jgi:hypothetical protein
MGTPPPNVQRRLALLRLQRLLVDAEASLSSGVEGVDPALRKVGEAFELFRSRYGDGADVAAPETPAAEKRRIALQALASVLTEMDESVSRRDAESIQGALERTKKALEICQHLDESAHASGFRLRFPSKLAK